MSNKIHQYLCDNQESSFNYDPTVAVINEINHDVLFREGRNNRDITYTPRLLMVDLKGVMKHFPERGELYEAPIRLSDEASIEKAKNTSIWDPESIEVVQEKAIEPHDYQKDLGNPEAGVSDEKNYNFGETVETWADYMYSRFHPRTITLLDKMRHSCDENQFDTFTYGKAKWKENDFEDDFTDKIRLYIEECDYFQGFQMIFDCVDGFSGLATECLQYLSDEYSYSTLAFPVIPPSAPLFKNCESAMSDSIRVANIAMAYAQLGQNSSLFVPLSTMTRGWRPVNNPRLFPLLSYDPESYYQTSSILASYLDTISLGYRHKETSSANYLPGLCSDMSNYGRKLGGAGFALPFNMSPSEDLIDCLDRADCPLFTELSPNTEVGTDRIIQSVFIRGIPVTRVKRPMESAQKQMQMAAYRCSNVSEMIQLYFQCNNYSSMAHCTSLITPMTLRTPFPREMFDVNLTYDGFLSEIKMPEKQRKFFYFSFSLFIYKKFCQ